MDSVINRILSNPKRSVFLSLAVVAVVSIVYFFFNFSIVVFRVNVANGVDASQSLSLFLDEKASGNLSSKGISIRSVPRSTRNIEVSTDKEGSVYNFSAPLIVGSFKIDIVPQSKITKVARPAVSRNDCAFKNGDISYSWSCDSADLDLYRTDYGDYSRYPRPKLDESSDNYSYVKRLSDGFVGFSKGDVPRLLYVDLRSGSARDPKTIDIRESLFTGYGQIYTDQKKPGSFAVISSETQEYAYFESTDSSPTYGKLSFDQGRTVDGFYHSFSLYDGSIFSHYGKGYSESHDRSVGDGEKRALINKFDVSTGKNTSSIELHEDGSKTGCDQMVITSGLLACTGSAYLTIYKLSDGGIIDTLDGSGLVAGFGDALLVSYKEDLYKFRADGSFFKAWSNNDYSISNINTDGPTPQIRLLFSRSSKSSTPLIYELNLSEYADYSAVEYSLPLTQDKMVGGDIAELDFNDQNIYLNLVVESSYDRFGSQKSSQDVIDDEFNYQKNWANEVLEREIPKFGQYSINYFY